ncbi:pentatricopeptide repeat-containing protein At3g16610-like [Papaver somniferum]|uniref:pentatricopeptide repeat-containing protein At3g16610-like n=1 Tax=Papaver somniferum TaxID=3469 RepID=UPI000E6F72B5|nr:pentatricopeptide repeat-containing protein At3g16610-like [Papaver somniferum]
MVMASSTHSTSLLSSSWFIPNHPSSSSTTTSTTTSTRHNIILRHKKISSLKPYFSSKPTAVLPLSSKLSETSTKTEVSSENLIARLENSPTTVSHKEGVQIHARIIQLGLSDNVYLSSKLLYFYYCVKDVDSAWSVFRSIPGDKLNQFFWNTMIRTYVDSDCFVNAVELFLKMLVMGFVPNEFTYPFVLKSCSALNLIEAGRQIHGFLIVNGYEHDVFAMSALLDFYVKCGCFWDACKLFDRLPERNEVTWNSMVSGYAQNGYWNHALEALELMGKSGIQVEVSSWNSIMAGCVRVGDGKLAFETFRRMLVSEFPVKPNSATFNTLLPIIPMELCLLNLKQLHGFAIRQKEITGLGSVDDERLSCSIASGYAYHGCIEYASELFDVIHLKTSQLWISMISGFINSNNSPEAFHYFQKMVIQCDGDFKNLSKVPLTLLLPECSPSSSTGLEIHAHAYRVGFESNTSVNNALVAMYARRGDIESSTRVFLRTPEKDIVSWNSMINCFSITNDFYRAIQLFQNMHSEDIKPDKFTFSSVLNGCGELAAHRQGTATHAYTVKSGFSEGYCVVQNSLMDSYGKCGCIDEAKQIFDEMDYKDVVSWNTIIKTYGLHARPTEALSLFSEMQEDGWKPNRITFIALLSACSHGGLVDEGLNFLQLMIMEYGIAPDVEHYTCVVDSLARVGRLQEAYDLIKSMTVKPDDCVWGALLGGCRIHGNVPLGEIAANHLMKLKPQHPGYHVLLSNIYKDASRENEAAQVRAEMKDRGVFKFPGCSWIEICGEFHNFMTADKSHKKCTNIYSTLDGLTKQLMLEGYVPNLEFKVSSEKLL